MMLLLIFSIFAASLVQSADLTTRFRWVPVEYHGNQIDKIGSIELSVPLNIPRSLKVRQARISENKKRNSLYIDFFLPPDSDHTFYEWAAEMPNNSPVKLDIDTKVTVQKPEGFKQVNSWNSGLTARTKRGVVSFLWYSTPGYPENSAAPATFGDLGPVAKFRRIIFLHVVMPLKPRISN